MADAECRVCKEIKDSTFDYYWSNGERQRRCKDCMKAYTVEWQRKARERIKLAKLKRTHELASIEAKKNEN